MSEPIIEAVPPRSPFLPSQQMIAFAVAFIVFSFVGIGFFKFVVLRSNLTIKNYEDCVASKGSTVLESYPAICVSRTGVRFIQPLTQEEQDLLKPPAPTEDFQEFARPSGETRVFTTSDKALSLMLPAGWIQTQPDQSVEPRDEDVKSLEFMKSGEGRGYPLGRVTVQYSKKEHSLTPEDSVFEPEAEVIGGTNYLVVSGEEAGGLVGAYQYLIYYGTLKENDVNVRLFTRFANSEEQSEQKAILSSISIPTEPMDVESTP